MLEPWTPLRPVVAGGTRRRSGERIRGRGIGSILGAYIPPPAGLLLLLWSPTSVGWLYPFEPSSGG